MDIKRVFLIVLDSVGIGAQPDADLFGDCGTNTMKRISESPAFRCENMKSLGLSNIDGVDYLGEVPNPLGAYARMTERSMGKDTTIGHWEIAGIVSEKPLPTYPDGFPDELLNGFSRRCGRGVLCNRPYSGTEVIKDYGAEHLRTGKLIVYTSADSVFQIAAHEAIVPPEELYGYCRIARELLCGEHGVGRVIARPFVGDEGAGFVRTANRRDFSLEPNGETLLDALKRAGRDVIAVGKITDIFAGRGITKSILTHSNSEGMAVTEKLLSENFCGLCFVNLVEFDMLYGHRNDTDGYAAAFADFDKWLGGFISGMKPEDALIITADHGCDPGDVSTDHTREYTPLIVFGEKIKSINLGIRSTFADIGATAARMLGVSFDCAGDSFLDEILKH